MAIKGLKKLQDDLDPEKLAAQILKIVSEEYGAEIIKAVRASAKVGVGPADSQYPTYSPAYAKKVAGVAQKNFLTATGALLAVERFSITADGTTLTLRWSGDDKLGIIATVHNDGLPIGRGGPVKQREFVHFESTATWAVLLKALERALDRVAADFNRG